MSYYKAFDYHVCCSSCVKCKRDEVNNYTCGKLGHVRIVDGYNTCCPFWVPSIRDLRINAERNFNGDNKQWSKRRLDNNAVGIYFGDEFIGFVHYDVYQQHFVGTHVVEGFSEPMGTLNDVYEWFRKF